MPPSVPVSNIMCHHKHILLFFCFPLFQPSFFATQFPSPVLLPLPSLFQFLFFSLTLHCSRTLPFTYAVKGPVFSYSIGSFSSHFHSYNLVKPTQLPSPISALFP